MRNERNFLSWTLVVLIANLISAAAMAADADRDGVDDAVDQCVTPALVAATTVVDTKTDSPTVGCPKEWGSCVLARLATGQSQDLCGIRPAGHTWDNPAYAPGLWQVSARQGATGARHDVGFVPAEWKGGKWSAPAGLVIYRDGRVFDSSGKDLGPSPLDPNTPPAVSATARGSAGGTTTNPVPPSGGAPAAAASSGKPAGKPAWLSRFEEAQDAAKVAFEDKDKDGHTWRERTTAAVVVTTAATVANAEGLKALRSEFEDKDKDGKTFRARLREELDGVANWRATTDAWREEISAWRGNVDVYLNQLEGWREEKDKKDREQDEDIGKLGQTELLLGGTVQGVTNALETGTVGGYLVNAKPAVGFGLTVGGQSRNEKRIIRGFASAGPTIDAASAKALGVYVNGGLAAFGVLPGAGDRSTYLALGGIALVEGAAYNLAVPKDWGAVSASPRFGGALMVAADLTLGRGLTLTVAAGGNVGAIRLPGGISRVTKGFQAGVWVTARMGLNTQRGGESRR